MHTPLSPSERAITRYTEYLLTHRAWFVAATLALIVACTAFLPRIKFDNTPDSYFIQGDSTLAMYDHFRGLFASDEYSLIVLDSPPQWTPAFVEELRSLQQALARLPHVRKATAITNVRYIQGDASGIDVGDFLPQGLAAAEIARRQALAPAHAHYSDLYVSRDARHLGIVVETEIIRGAVDYKVELTRRIRALLAEQPYRNWSPRAVGAPIIDADVRAIVSHESGLFGAAAFAMIGIGFMFVFRSWAGVLLPMGIAVLAIVATFGVMGAIGAPVGLLTPIIPSFLVSVGVGPCVFLMTEIYTCIAQGDQVGDAIVHGMRNAGLPGIMAALTTAGALLAFSSSSVAPVRDLGVLMGIGLILALALTLVLVPLGFSVYRHVPRSERRNQLIHGRVRTLERVCEFVLRWPVAILGVIGALVLLAAVGMSRLTTDYWYLGSFKDATGIRQDYAAVDEALRASSSIELLVRGQASDTFKEPASLRALDALGRHVEEYARISTKAYSLADVVKEINQALHDGNPAYYRIPDTKAAVSQALLLFESSGRDDLTHVVSGDYSEARLTVRVPTLPDSHYHPLVTEIESYAARELRGAALSAPLEVTVTGLVPMWMKINGYLAHSQISSLLVSAILVTGVMMLMFRSVLLGLFASAANAIVVVFVLGLMGTFGIVLDPYTVLVAAIALGILDDDTLHFIRHIRRECERGLDINDAIRSGYRSVGQAMLYTTAVLVFGFAIYSLSSVASLTKFGLLVSLTLVLGCLTEYLITPALILVLDRFGLFYRREPAPVVVAAHDVGAQT